MKTIQLKPYLQKRWQELGFKQPTPIQKLVIPLIQEGKDVIAQSPTGTGKTLAYLLPIIEKIEVENRGTQAVILAPTQELVMQIFQEAIKWTEGSSIRVASLAGGANLKRQIEKLKERPHLVIGTPGRVFELIERKRLKMHEVKTMVLDEGDQLLHNEHVIVVRSIVQSALRDRQLLLFSATPVKDMDIIEAMIGRTPEVVTVRSKTSSSNANVTHYYILCEPRKRGALLKKLASIKGMRALVFVRSVGSMNMLYEKLQYEGVKVAALHSHFSKRERERALKQIKNGEITFLLATDLAARGLDIKGLPHVIHYDFPENIEQYVHRSGRTGRMGKKGTVISLVTFREERELKKYGRALNIPIHQGRLYQGIIVKEGENTKERKQ